jgi:hypothetical protein
LGLGCSDLANSGTSVYGRTPSSFGSYLGRTLHAWKGRKICLHSCTVEDLKLIKYSIMQVSWPVTTDTTVNQLGRGPGWLAAPHTPIKLVVTLKQHNWEVKNSVSVKLGKPQIQ